ncbi:MAG: hypothetical protein Q7T48_09755 [Cellvibrio sp.]|uniref:hypothetical protein n=1 Tax=Cellvibrio sp. TaxID=1965322 RepID=UPI0026C0EB01|nr:hypothetical protein [Cellvibrio sp.]
MLKITLKMCAALLCTSALASQAFAEDLASAGSYGNYLKPGCTWNSLGKTYSPMTVSGGQQIGVVIAEPVGLFCPPGASGTSAPQAVKVHVTYDFYSSYWGTDHSTCSIYPAAGMVVGTGCDNYKVSRP